jgi:hypothetical protein
MTIGRRFSILGLLLFAADASAQNYQILGGTLSGPGSQREPLTGDFAAHAFIGLEPGSMHLFVHDFALQAGEQTFTPAPPCCSKGCDPCSRSGARSQ